jgi:thiopurine S-methyltransferase
MARAGFETTGLDLVAEAIRQAQELYRDVTGLTFRTGDIFKQSEMTNGFDGIVDRAMLCALNPQLQGVYVQTCAKLLKTGGLFMGILFSHIEGEPGRQGPPFAVTLDEMTAMFGSGFSLVALEEKRVMNESPTIIKGEWLCIWKRKAEDA